MTIFNQTDCLTLRHAAINYLLKGYSVIPLIGKKPSMGWLLYQQQRATAGEIRWWEGQGWLQNLGVVCGKISGNLIVIDLDGENAVTHFQQRFPALVRDTFVVRTGHGLHVYLKCDQLPANRKISLGDGHNGLEIRGNGQYVVAPPSVHPDTSQPYEIAIRKPVLRVFDLAEVNAWLDTLAAPPVAPVKSKDKPSIGLDSPVVIRDRTGRIVGNPAVYARTALQDECHRVLTAWHGDQNNALYRGAQRMGQFVKIGLLTTAEVERVLTQAARGWSDSDQSEGEILKTIHSGLNSTAAEDGR